MHSRRLVAQSRTGAAIAPLRVARPQHALQQRIRTTAPRAAAHEVRQWAYDQADSTPCMTSSAPSPRRSSCLPHPPFQDNAADSTGLVNQMRNVALSVVAAAIVLSPVGDVWADIQVGPAVRVAAPSALPQQALQPHSSAVG